jgi:microcystin degradation protein MlrC
MKILLAGFEHETNTFAPSKAAYLNFVNGEGYPGMARGAEMLQLRDVNLATGGFIRAAEEYGDSIDPVIWAGASASAHVTRDAYERIASEIVKAAGRGDFDAIHLNLHGAMVAEHLDDGEGELLARLRQVVGREVPIFGSVDLHANVTEKMLGYADGLVAYRTYPHLDMAETGRRAAALHRCYLNAGRKVYRASRRIPFLIPINGMCTWVEPAFSVYAAMKELETGEVLSLSFAPGFPAADFPECGPTVWGYGLNPLAVESAVDELYRRIVANEPAWAVAFLSPEEAVSQAIRISGSASRPVVISDTQDNPGAGGDGNTTGMLRALVEQRAERAALGVFFDPAAVAAAEAAGVGKFVTLALGGTSRIEGDEPFTAEFEVETLSDGKCVFDGPMLHGTQVNLGGVACLRIGGVRIVVSATKAQMFDRNLFRVAGIEPEGMKILVNKSSVHFRADFGPISEAILVAKSPGPMKADPGDLPWTRLAKGMRVRPGGAAFNV